jgi:hypothetical protein
MTISAGCTGSGTGISLGSVLVPVSDWDGDKEFGSIGTGPAASCAGGEVGNNSAQNDIFLLSIGFFVNKKIFFHFD